MLLNPQASRPIPEALSVALHLLSRVPSHFGLPSIPDVCAPLISNQPAADLENDQDPWASDTHTHRHMHTHHRAQTQKLWKAHKRQYQ